MTLQQVALTNGETIAYRKKDGGIETILLVHGNMTSSKHWDVLMDAIDSKYTVYALDLRGFGGSSYHTRITQIKDFSDDLKGFVDALDLKDFNLIGWSTGGAVCLQFEVDYPGLCQKLVLLASASTRGYPFFGSNVDGTLDLDRRLQTIEEVEQDPARTIAVQGMYDTENREGLQAVWNALIYTHNQPEEEKYKEYLNDMLTQRNLADVYQALNTFNISSVSNGLKDGTNQAKNITIPVLILRGDRDYVITEEMTHEIVADLGDSAVYVPLVNAGHSPLIDDLGALKEHIEVFLNEE
ncbi:intracellular short-chain-length polyhydroxyalkanoate depolymerase [Sporosarcina sp. CAU 1771]